MTYKTNVVISFVSQLFQHSSSIFSMKQGFNLVYMIYKPSL